MATKQEIRNKALRKLGRYRNNASPSASISADIDDAYLEVYERLENEGLVTWASDADIPTEYVGPIVALVASERATEYATSNDRYMRLVNDSQRAEVIIRRLTNDSYIPSVTPISDY